MMVWRYYTGSPLHPAQVEPLRPTTPFFVVSLFSTRGGLFPWSPVAYASLVGLLFSARARTTTLALLAVFALEVYVVSSAWVVTGGYGYGARRLSDGAPLMALGHRASVGALRGGALAVATPAGRGLRRALRAPQRRRDGAVAREKDPVVGRLRALRRALPRRLRAARARPRLRRHRLSVRAAGRLAVRAGAPRAGVDVRERRWQLVPRPRRPVAAGAVARHDLSTRSARGYVLAGLAFAPPRAAGARDGAGPPALADVRRRADQCTPRRPVPAGTRAATWNGAPVRVTDEPKGVRISRPRHGRARGHQRARAHAARRRELDRIDFESTSTWWRKP